LAAPDSRLTTSCTIPARKARPVDEADEMDPPTTQFLPLVGAVLDDVALDDLLQRVVLLARHAVPAADSVSITVADGDRFHTSNSTNGNALEIDQAQYDQDDGPCLRAMRTSKQLQVTVGRDVEEWPIFTARAQDAGIHGVLSTPLTRAGESIGALNIYRRQERPFDDTEAQTARLIGEHGSIVLGKALDLSSATKLNEQLKHAVASREIIGEAKGILMESQSCSRDEAFDILRRASQRRNRKLREIAEEMVTRVEARNAGTRGEK
jgi:GAF domain-containing protein